MKTKDIIEVLRAESTWQYEQAEIMYGKPEQFPSYYMAKMLERLADRLAEKERE